MLLQGIDALSMRRSHPSPPFRSRGPLRAGSKDDETVAGRDEDEARVERAARTWGFQWLRSLSSRDAKTSGSTAERCCATRLTMYSLFHRNRLRSATCAHGQQGAS